MNACTTRVATNDQASTTMSISFGPDIDGDPDQHIEENRRLVLVRVIIAELADIIRPRVGRDGYIRHPHALVAESSEPGPAGGEQHHEGQQDLGEYWWDEVHDVFKGLEGSGAQ